MIHCLKEKPAYITYCGLSVEKLKPQFGPIHSDPARFLAAPPVRLGSGPAAVPKCRTCIKTIRQREKSAAAAAADAERADKLAAFLARGQAAQKAVDQAIAKGGGA